MNRKSPPPALASVRARAEEVDEIYASAIDKIRCWIREKRIDATARLCEPRAIREAAGPSA